ncbi:MAG: hypothetical protein K2Z80_03700 [Xanthobacteraceae bacterium]|nr:hypothetical protein [Xanthobacteraceae bacterium]
MGLLAIGAAQARDLGQWHAADPAVAAWFKKLRQPDNPSMSCCGESDAYFADDFEVSGDRYVAIVTDDRPDGPLRRLHVPRGTRIVIPKHKIKHDEGNPTGHGIVFYNPLSDIVHCYVPPGGV